MRTRGFLEAALVAVVLWAAPGPSFAQHVPQSMNFVFTPFVIALAIIIPFKIIALAWTVRKPAWGFVIPVTVASGLTVYLTIPLIFGNYFNMPFHPDRYVTLILVSTTVLFCLAYCIDGAIILLTRLLFDPVDRLLLGTTMTNLVVFVLLAAFGIGFWNFSQEGYVWMVTLGDMLVAATYRLTPIMLLM